MPRTRYEVDRGEKVVDIKNEPEEAYAEHCRLADISTCRVRRHVGTNL